MNTGYTFIDSPEHLYRGHPEHPERLRLLQERLGTVLATRLPSAPAGLDEVERVHTHAYLAALEEGCGQGPGIIDHAPTYVTRSSLQDALRAAGGALACARAVIEGQLHNAFAIVRPPGHHAEAERAMGFCLLNNIAIATHHALASGIERVMIVDYDAHHGNGTQAVFLRDDRVAFISLHQWGIYPGTGWIDEVPGARGRMINVPLEAGSGDLAYVRAMDEIVKPAAEQFRPQMLLVSAGFDAHWRDPLTSLGLSTAGYFAMSRRLVELARAACEGRIVFVLEGGYDATNLANGAGAVFAALAGQADLPDTGDAYPGREPDVTQRFAAIARWHGFEVQAGRAQ